MKKALGVAFILCAEATSAQAQSSLTLYGIVDASVQYVNNIAVATSAGGPGSPINYENRARTSFYSGGAYPDRWGLKGKESLGGGLDAIFQLENGFNIGTGAFSSGGTEFNRQAFVGLSSTKYGAVTLGRQYEAITDLLYIYGPANFTGSSGTYAGDVSNTDMNIRVSNSVKYRTPNIGGFTGVLLYGFGGLPGSMSAGSTVSVGANYVSNSFAAGLAYLRMMNGSSQPNTWSGSSDSLFNSTVNPGFAGARTVQIFNLVTKYFIGSWAFGLNYGYTQYRPSSTSLFSESQAFSSVGAGAQYQMTPAFSVSVAYAYTRGQSVRDGEPAPQYHSLSARGLYSLSKATVVYLLAGYSHVKGSTLDQFGNIIPATGTIGDSSNYGSPSASNNQALVRIGVYHMF